MGATRHPHSFLGMNEDGVTSIVRTSGNPHAHVVLRGGRAKTNYDAESIRAAEAEIDFRKTAAGADGGLQPRELGKEIRQAGRCLAQRDPAARRRHESLIGLMVESHLNEGNQPIPKNLADLRYGVSITDSCIGWETTERMLRWGYATLK